jgi:hypothetical protein
MQADEDAVASFLNEVCTTLLMPVATLPAQHRKGWVIIPATADGLPQHSTQVEAQGKHREVQAQNVMMRKGQITSEKHSPDADALAAYNTVFCSPLRSSHHKVIRALFTARCIQPPVEVGDMELA